MKAFPQEGQINYKLIGNNWVVDKEQGMDLRDYFAAKAMQAIIASTQDEQYFFDSISKMAYLMADTMMEARNAKK